MPAREPRPRPAEDLRRAAGRTGVLVRLNASQPTHALRRSQQVIEAADRLRGQFAKHTPRPQPDILQRANGFPGGLFGITRGAYAIP